MYTQNYIKKLLSFTSLCFFSPLVQLFLYTKDFELEQENKEFIISYIKLGYFNIIYVLSLIGAYIAELFYHIDFLQYIYQYGAYPFFLILILEIVFLLEGRTISFGKIFNPSKTQGEIFDIIRYYMPGYNFYMQITGSDNLKYYLKESILARTTFALSVFFLPSIISKTIFVIIIFRIISLVAGMDLVSGNIKEKINGLFQVLVEEIWGIFIGSVIFVIDIFRKKIDKEAFPTYLKFGQSIYGKYYEKNIKSVLFEYITIFIIIIYWIVNDIYSQAWWENFDFWTYFAIIIIVIKYLLSIKNNKLVLIPIIHEIIHYLKKLVLYFYKKILGKS